MQVSVVRSTVSLDSPREAVLPEESTWEVERLRRRNVLLEKGRVMMEEELQLFREEIQSKNRRIEQLSQQIARGKSQGHHSTPNMRCGYDGEAASSASVMLLEKEQELAIVGEALRSQSQLLSQLQQQNAHLKEELANNACTIRQLKDSFRAQLNFQQAQVDALQRRLMEKDREMQAERVIRENLAQKEIAKWQKMVESLKEQLRVSEENNMKESKRQKDEAQERIALKEKNQNLQYQVEDLNQKVKFLHDLLQQAKGAFIDAQLQQQDSLQQKQREKRQYRKRNQLLKTQIKSLKGHPETPPTPSTLCNPSNKSTRTMSSTISVTPFRSNAPSRTKNTDTDHDPLSLS